LLQTGNDGNNANPNLAPNHRLKTFLNSGGNPNVNEADGAQPIADLFPNCTVMFADIAGFTAWSSSREPAQVFVLLQAVYQAFDALAKKRRVFKVETIGDSYVAVTGLPEPQPNHAVIMARFSWECMLKMNEITKELEVTLGPDTGELTMRFGLHSGPVTAGVLRGERARFQLFGDTVNTGTFVRLVRESGDKQQEAESTNDSNGSCPRTSFFTPSHETRTHTAARMESTGVRDKIQCSQATADILIESGKQHWLKLRPDGVAAKGKGLLTTYWLNPSTRVATESLSTDETGSNSDDGDAQVAPSPLKEFNLKQERLVDWMVELLLDPIRKMVRDIDIFLVVSPCRRSSVWNARMWSYSLFCTISPIGLLFE
jgi:Adenylate and Guanylate cyclase catalytic domain